MTELDHKNNFNWQSLVVDPSASPLIGIDIMVVIYSIGFEILGRKVCGPWQVLKSFEGIFRIHDFIGMTTQVSETDDAVAMVVHRADFDKHIGRIRLKNLGVIYHDK